MKIVEYVGVGDAKEAAPYIGREFTIVGTWIQAVFEAGVPWDQEVTKETYVEEGDETFTLYVDGKKIFTATSCWRGSMGAFDVDWHIERSGRKWITQNGEIKNYRYSWEDKLINQ